MKRVYRRSYIKLEVDEERQLMVQSWTAYCTSKEFRKAQLQTIKYFEKYNCKFFISNTLKAGVLDQSDTDWAAEVVTPQLMQHGMRAIHFIIPENKFAMMAVKNYEERDKEVNGLTLDYFTTVEEAIEHIFE